MANNPKPSSKLPDFEEVSGMIGKLFKDLQKSLTEIYDDYQLHHGSNGARKAPPHKQTRPPKKPEKTETKTDDED